MVRAVAGSPPKGRPYSSLRGRTAFRHVYRTGQRRRVEGITVIRATGLRGQPQVGIVAGRRTGNAVARNRAKRRIRAALCFVPLRGDANYIVLASTAVLTAPFDRLVNWLCAASGTSRDQREEER